MIGALVIWAIVAYAVIDTAIASHNHKKGKK